MRTRQIITLGVVTLTMIVANEGSAQTAAKASMDFPVEANNAELFEARAAALHDQPARALEAARLYRWSAQLREAKDPQAIESLAMAAHLFGYAKQPGEARKVMEQAAERALARGDVARAAQAYIDAAFFAELQKRNADVNRLGRKALHLTASPLLSTDQRAAITNRIRSSENLAGTLKASSATDKSFQP